MQPSQFPVYGDKTANEMKLRAQSPKSQVRTQAQAELLALIQRLEEDLKIAQRIGPFQLNPQYDQKPQKG